MAISDRLDAMRAFVTVADLRGFAAAARRLELSPSAVTRLVAGLEARLGVRLLQRTTRNVGLTDGGARFLERARRILAEIEEAEQSAQDERARPSGRLVVAAPLLFGRQHVTRIVSRYLALHPHVGAELQLSDRIVNLIEDGVDVAIRIGQLADSSLIARRLGRTRRVLVASPGYLAARGGPPRHPADLAADQLIAFRPMTPGRDWVFHDPSGGDLAVDVAVRFATNSGDAALDHALGGGGITAAYCYQVVALVRSGDLVEVLSEFGPSPVPIHAVFPTSRLLSSKVRAFLDLAEQDATTWPVLAGS